MRSAIYAAGVIGRILMNQMMRQVEDLTGQSYGYTESSHCRPWGLPENCISVNAGFSSTYVNPDFYTTSPSQMNSWVYPVVGALGISAIMGAAYCIKRTLPFWTAVWNGFDDNYEKESQSALPREIVKKELLKAQGFFSKRTPIKPVAENDLHNLVIERRWHEI